MSIDWAAAAVLPNVSLNNAITGDGIALTPPDDPRILSSQAGFLQFIARFTDAFLEPLRPTIIIVRADLLSQIADIEPIASFRDVLASCVVPYSRALNTIYRQWPRICYSDYFWIYPWMVGVRAENLVANTPALHGVEETEKFHGQSSPGLAIAELNDLDKPLYDALISRWSKHHVGKKDEWNNVALFRSLNMAQQAAMLPAGRETTIYDLGRLLGLWVSAFEILAHPGGKGRSDIRTVQALFERGLYTRSKLNRQSCDIYGKLYKLRNDFIHGNPIEEGELNPGGGRPSIFWIAPCLYRLALTAFLNMPKPDLSECKDFADYKVQGTQGEIEDAILKFAD
jgi:hypothetical protein